MFVQILVHVVQ